ncbi:beat protein [Nesidiocoris tenuis]|uniref:Beat protein n=1 Tax=Nesidiocoris tenuis TaxID=355587 RepID=A0ABN7AW78_9HEMI|nr:beat protein [Nesidiocoris tenuis]
MPNHGPHISMDKKFYLKNEEFEANCTSAKSFPATVLKWYINDSPVDDDDWLIEYPPEIHAHRLLTTTVGLRGIAYPEYFVKGNMKLKCVASLSPMLWQGSGESTLQSMSDILDGREAMLLVRGGSVRIFSSAPLLVLAFFLTS